MNDAPWNRVRQTYGLPRWRNDPDPVFLEPATTPTSELLLHADVARLTAQVTDLREQLDHANTENQRLRTQLAGRIADAATLITLDDSQHEHHAQRYLDLIQQTCRKLARAACVQTGLDTTQAAIARNISIITRGLFAEQGSPTDLCLRLGLDHHAHNHDAATLVHTANELSTDCVTWDFDAAVGTRPDPTYQKPWGTCDPSTPVAFVVAPAYRANERLYAHQQVFTDPPTTRANLANYFRPRP